MTDVKCAVCGGIYDTKDTWTVSGIVHCDDCCLETYPKSNPLTIEDCKKAFNKFGYNQVEYKYSVGSKAQEDGFAREAFKSDGYCDLLGDENKQFKCTQGDCRNCNIPLVHSIDWVKDALMVIGQK
jgi:hypothetical protein